LQVPGLGKAAGEPAVTPIPGLGLKISRRDRKNHEKQKKATDPEGPVALENFKSPKIHSQGIGDYFLGEVEFDANAAWERWSWPLGFACSASFFACVILSP
jgi:hypothetical protein